MFACLPSSILSINQSINRSVSQSEIFNWLK